MIAAILAGVAAVMYVVFRVIHVVCAFIPMIGKRHRHPTWAHLNQQSHARTTTPRDCGVPLTTGLEP